VPYQNGVNIIIQWIIIN